MLNYSATTADTNYYNLAQDLSVLNARNEEITDRKGNLYGYWCKVSTLSSANDNLILGWVPNTWKVRNAFRRFHFAREEMFRDAGITRKEMGSYGRTLRPYFSYDHKTSGSEPLRLFNVGTLAGVNATGGEWTYSKLGSSVPWVGNTDAGNVTKKTLVDEYELTILDDHEIQDAQTATRGAIYTTVGMVQAYVQDRMEMIPDATAESSIEGKSNPLASLTALSAAAGEITEIAEDQQLEAPPYDITDDGDCIRAVYDFMPVAGTAGATAAHRDWGLFFFPAGIIAMQNGIANSNALQIEVVGKELCKDVA